MASMNRNLNLEEVNSDAFMGIPFLNHQTVLQKIIFWGCVLLCIIVNLLGNFLFQLSVSVIGTLTLLPLLPAVAFGCNYNEDLTIIRYIVLLLSKPSKTYDSMPTEDIAELNKIQDCLRLEEKMQGQNGNGVTRDSQRKLLIKLIVGIVTGIVALVLLLILISSSKEIKEIHHTVSVIYQHRKGVPL